MRPACGARMPHSRLRNVDLPLPDGPISRMRSRAGSAKSRTASENARLAGPGERHVAQPDDIARRRAGRPGRRAVHRRSYIIPPRSMRGLARLTSNLLCPLGVMTVTSSFWAPAKTLK